MATFQDEEAASKVRARLESLTHSDLQEFFARSFERCPDPDQAARNLERWLRATSNPHEHLAHLLSTPQLTPLVMLLLGASQPLADAVIQNPELATLLTDPRVLQQVPNTVELLAEGRRLASSSTSYSHTLDRLRFLKQKTLLPLTVSDLAGIRGQEEIWRGLSHLADALIRLAFEAATRQARGSQDQDSGPSPDLMVVAMGKLGGEELNYSSDVDLVYVCPDGLEPSAEAELSKTCEMLNRALADRMGRGALYRVDLRLRPYGRSGPLVASMRSIESYYRSHAETWELQALIRSRAVFGPEELKLRWEGMRAEYCFGHGWSTARLSEIVSMRTRVETHAGPDDLKRGPGGIRDVEFATQILQLILGHQVPEVRERPTLDALRNMERLGLIAPERAANLISGYTFLRKLEHRCQLAGDVQTHSLPTHPQARERLAAVMEFGSWDELHQQVEQVRAGVREGYAALLSPLSDSNSARGQVLEGQSRAKADLARWFDSLPDSDRFYESLLVNKDSLRRVERIAVASPAAIDSCVRDVGLTEAILSGEIEEDLDCESFDFKSVGEGSLAEIAAAARRCIDRLKIKWTLAPDFPVWDALSRVYDGLVGSVANRLNAGFDVLALGSYANQSAGFVSDLDLMFLAEDSGPESAHEKQAQAFLGEMRELRSFGIPVNCDLRLRPEGRHGMLVRTYEGFSAYELGAMDLWERFALGECRTVWGSSRAFELVVKAAYALPITPERLQELLAMKKRIETERVTVKYRTRNVKLGVGGLSDIEWFVHLHEMRYPTATEAGTLHRLDDRLRQLARARLINAVELDALSEGLRHLLTLRERLALLGLTTDIVPENPDRLDRLAWTFGFERGNEFLAKHEHITSAVRLIFLEGIERLRA
ncbi:MAG: hypothetical protein QY327_09630 [Fimbriimonadaceae bacterium]|nr:MAG: hypothetical protein DCC46_03410 [Armatimonadota bacterium]WKZ79596.1 MAG: hypothetical protein QY327_09630 [Fimbriimonadaceae bacterium]